MEIKCPYCKSNDMNLLYNVFDIIRDEDSEQAHIVKELENLGYKIYGCDNCCQIFIVRE